MKVVSYIIKKSGPLSKDPGKKDPDGSELQGSDHWDRKRETAKIRSHSICLGTEDLVRGLSAELKNKIDLLLDNFPGRGRREGHRRGFQC